MSITRIISWGVVLVMAAVVLVGCQKEELPSSSGDGGEESTADKRDVELTLSETVVVSQGEMSKLNLTMPEADTGEKEVRVRFRTLPRRVRLTNAMFVGRGRNRRLVLAPVDLRKGVTVDIAADRRAKPIEDEVIKVEAVCGNVVGRGEFRLTVKEDPKNSWPTGFSTTATFEVPVKMLLVETREYLKGEKYKLRQLTDQQRPKETNMYVESEQGRKLEVDVSQPFEKKAWLSVHTSKSSTDERLAKAIIEGVSQRVSERIRGVGGPPSLDVSDAVSATTNESGRMEIRAVGGATEQEKIVVEVHDAPKAMAFFGVPYRWHGDTIRLELDAEELAGGMSLRVGLVRHRETLEGFESVRDKPIKVVAQLGDEKIEKNVKLTLIKAENGDTD